MKTADLDRRITLRRSTTTKDVFNADVVSWSDLATVWASKLDVRDAERVEAAKVGATLTSRFRIDLAPSVADLNPKDEVVCGARTYGIESVKEVTTDANGRRLRRPGLEITATARAD